MRKKRSIIWTTPLAVFIETVRSSNTLAEILRRLGSTVKGGNYKTLKKRLAQVGVDCSHIAFGLRANLGRIFVKPSQPLEDVMVEHSSYSRKSLKKRLINEKLLPERCAVCGLGPQWNYQILVLVLDHINGECDDHRFDNLRLLCPNCNSQTPTFSGRHKTRPKSELHRVGQMSCRHVERPADETLLKEIGLNSYSAGGFKN